ncbi:hypothetical protein VPH35_129313 [Triticum aestivum]
MEGRRVRGCSGSAGCRPSRRSIRQPLLRRPRSQRLFSYSPQVPEEQLHGDRLNATSAEVLPVVEPLLPPQATARGPRRPDGAVHAWVAEDPVLSAGWVAARLLVIALDLLCVRLPPAARPTPTRQVQKEVLSRLWSSDAISCFCQLPVALRIN